MEVFAGSSGFSYDFWKGSFYPADIKSQDMLAFYAAAFPAVEINNTFYRMPNAAVLRRWYEVVPATFRFVIKASRRITHVSRLGDVGDNLSYLYRQLEALGEKCGAVLFQCPPNLRMDIERLRGFLAALPGDARAVLEFRHTSWFCDEVFDALKAYRACLCMSDEDRPDPPLVPTADFGYLRLRAAEYDHPSLLAWRDQLAAHWPRVYVFFKHEETAPSSIRRMLTLVS